MIETRTWSVPYEFSPSLSWATLTLDGNELIKLEACIRIAYNRSESKPDDVLRLHEKVTGAIEAMLGG